ncbi:SLBB domain-containing protein [Oculatella sp. LEGE 06141]|uniref:SLBB domain-containing protein n=1 Tax=Oculatella sp. LEGE 06141 TaxID=1828648 RepID=UPI001D1567C8|nr:SLBB domain-containing protein [Oculatella sp. LEGE 06141]
MSLAIGVTVHSSHNRLFKIAIGYPLMRAVFILSLSATALSRIGFVVAHEPNVNVQASPQPSLPNPALEAKHLSAKHQFKQSATTVVPESMAVSRSALKRSPLPLHAPPPFAETASAVPASLPKPIGSETQPLVYPTVTPPDTSHLPWDAIVARSLKSSPGELPTTVRSQIAREVALFSLADDVAPDERTANEGSPTNGSDAPADVVLVQAASNATPTNGVSPTNVDETYTLGPGDSISVSFFNVPEYNGQYQVLVDGTLNMPTVGSISVKGMTLREAGDAISSRYSAELRHPRVTIGLIAARPLQIGILGEVGQPGLYTLPLVGGAQFPTLTQIIQTAGGATQAANLRQIEIRRPTRSGSPQTITVNLWDFLQNGDLSQNLSLRDGDTIFIAATSEVNLAETAQLADSNLASNTNEMIDIALIGEVNRPGAYKLQGGIGNRPTLTQAIQTAGGITPSADLREIQIRRATRRGAEQLININLWQLVQSGDLSQDLILQAGDTILIPTAGELTTAEAIQLGSANISPTAIQVSVIGEVGAPGSVDVPSNATLNQAIIAAGGLGPRAQRTVKLLRLNPNGTLSEQEVQVDLTQGIDPNTNPIVRNNDIIVVNRTGFARLSDGLSSLLGSFFMLNPLFRLLPF